MKKKEKRKEVIKKRADITLIAGPTASGKSAFALSLATQKNAAIINADSMQVYQELRLLTARPSQEEEGRAAHKLYGFISARKVYSTGHWIKDAGTLIACAIEEGQPLIIVGGTGLYFSALLCGLSPIPDIPDSVRDHWRASAKASEKGALHKILKERDPQMAEKLNPSDTQRLVRALEVFEATGRSLSDWQKIKGMPTLEPDQCQKWVIAPDRKTLYARSDTRFDQMIKEGALEEVKSFANMELDPALPAMRALGVRPLMRHLTGEISRTEAISSAKTETRRYAKRQMTWLKSKMNAWEWKKT